VTERVPSFSRVADGITSVDTVMAGEREFNAVFLISASEPALVETGPAADVDVLVDGLVRLGVEPGDLAHLIATHVHLDHAGGAGVLLQRFPKARVWIHERGAPHLVDPTRLVASTARTFGSERMLQLYGRTQPVPAGRVVALNDGDRISLGDRKLTAIHTPGHARHHLALQDDLSGAIFTGEAVGTHLPWADSYRPALPPPEADVEAALDSIDRLKKHRPTMLLISHFGAMQDVDRVLDMAAERIRSWSERVRWILEDDSEADPDRLAAALTGLAASEFLQDSGGPMTPADLARYDVIGSIRMNGVGLARYWRKRWEAEGRN
jgi:glyoxylase-like metal-dependent hydrolase (beta-lactamase superfamily II)